VWAETLGDNPSAEITMIIEDDLRRLDPAHTAAARAEVQAQVDKGYGRVADLSVTPTVLSPPASRLRAP
jgi:hypothetical protein